MAVKTFASQADLADKTVRFDRLADGVYAYTTEGDPNSGVVVGENGVLVMDAQATPAMAQDVLRCIREVTDRPVLYLVLSHYHAVRVLGASAYGAREIIASEATRALVRERGQHDFESEVNRFPRLFRDVESIPGLTVPTLSFESALTLTLGGREVRLLHLGRGHTKGDIVAWLPEERVLLSGDLVEYGATPYAGDAYLRDWPATLARLRALKPERLVPGRGAALTSRAAIEEAIEATGRFITRLYEEAAKGVAAGKSLKAVFEESYAALEKDYGRWVIFEHCMPFDVARAYDEASGIEHPRIWTKERDLEMWRALRG